MLNELLIKDHLKNKFGFSDKTDWLSWPPNTFAVTSEILMKTGAYRYVLSNIWEAENERNVYWQREIERESQSWKVRICNRFNVLFDIDPSLQIKQDRPGGGHASPAGGRQFLSLEAHVERVLSIIDLNLTFNNLRTVSQERLVSDDKKEVLNQFVESLLTIHCIADESCTGLGLTGSRSGKTSVYNCIANLLLISTGSLSTFSKQLGIVIPKMRTPQTGLSIRSFSHHLTYHETEVEIIWRMFPWANIQENTLNILTICWPKKINNSFFSSTPETFKSIRFFEYSTESLRGEDQFDPVNVIKLIESYRAKGIERIHMIVLPEIALSEAEWYALLEDMATYYRQYYVPKGKEEKGKGQIPIILSGVRRNRGMIAGEKVLTNELRIASFFAGKWYTVSQRKHHRWRLDGNQIRQYELAGRLSTSRKWFENIELSQRRLSIITPNGWLSLCPLICEDLAQLEPVSSIIRGIGPTILIALLADGPQLKFRWSARYASVFADDPGTSVLTVTSAGMVHKSKPKNVEDAENKTIALWKDQIDGVQTIDHNDRSKGFCTNFLLTVSGQWVEEYTADGRSDHQNASVIKLEGVDYADLEEEPANLEEFKAHREEARKAFRSDGEETSNAPDRSLKYADRLWNDIREISAGMSLVDAMIELSHPEYLKIIDPLLKNNTRDSSTELDNSFYGDLIRLINKSARSPLQAGILAIDMDATKKGRNKKDSEWPTLSFQIFLIHFQRIYRQFTSALGQNPDTHHKYAVLLKTIQKAKNCSQELQGDHRRSAAGLFPGTVFGRSRNQKHDRSNRRGLFYPDPGLAPQQAGKIPEAKQNGQHDPRQTFRCQGGKFDLQKGLCPLVRSNREEID